MNYSQQQAHLELRDYVRCYWKIENNKQGFKNFTILPDGFFDLLVCFRYDKLSAIFLSGLWSDKANVVISPGTTIYGVQFRLLAMEKIIKESISSMFNDVKKLERTHWGIDEYEAHDGQSFFEFLDAYLRSHLKGQKPVDSRKSTLLKLINDTKGTKTVEFYSQNSYWSSRQINRYFSSTFGLSLKSYCSMRKAASSFSQIKKGQLAPKQGYYDQSHFIKEMKKNTGFTPKELLKNENDRFLQFSIIKSE